MLLFFFNTLGRLLAWAPAIIPQGLSELFGSLLFYVPTKRRRLILSNLHHVFPEKPFTELKKMARRSCIHTVEMALFALASPFFSKERAQKHISLHSSLEGVIRQSVVDHARPKVLLVPHFTGMESITMISSFNFILTLQQKN